MKVESFYLNDISNYDDIVDYLTATIHDKFYGIGKNSISLARFISFLKRAVKIYVKLKYNKDVIIILTLPSIDDKIINHDKGSANIVKIRLSSEKINDILCGEYSNFEEYIQEILDQLETELTSNNKFSFTEYMNVQMNGLVEVALLELKSTYSTSFLKNNIIKKECWIKLAQHSSIFNDYYKSYMESNNKKLFYAFLKALASKL